MNTLYDIWNIIMGNLYLRFLFILVVAVVVAFIAKLVVKGVLNPLAKKTKTKIDDLIVKSISSVIFYIVIAVGFKVGFQNVEFETSTWNNLIDTMLVIIVAVLLVRIVRNFTKHWKVDWAARTESTADDRLIPLIEKILGAIVVILAFIFIFDTWNINITPLLGTAGIAGIALSFAVKDSLANVLGGIQLVMDKTFKVGDKVEIESGEMGVILDIGLRSTKLNTYDNEVIYIPNGNLANAKIKNFTVPDLSIRVNVNFGVVYGSDTEKVRQVVLDAVKKTENILEKPEPVVQFLKMSDFSLDFVARAWVAEYTLAYQTKIETTDAIYNALNKAGIGIPFPTRTVYMKSQG
jgi:small-conductance mechanosensitive channel